MTSTITNDLTCIGGGALGLWLMRCARQQGYDAALFEADTLGSGQTIASQGILHGGFKYALHGRWSSQATSLSTLPAWWQRTLTGQQQPDLRAVSILAREQLLLVRKGLRAQISSLLMRRTLSGRIMRTTAAPVADLMADLQSAWILQETVLDPHSLVTALSAPLSEHLFHHRVAAANWQHTNAGYILNTPYFRLQSRTFVLCAGAGNATLQPPDHHIPMQLRPLHMVIVVHPELPSVFAHVLDGHSKPQITITSKDRGNWYLGGALAEHGVKRGTNTQIAAAQTLMQECFPGIDWKQAQWRTLRINRAEAQQPRLRLPADIGMHRHHNLIISWPHKLVRVPQAAAKILSMLPPPCGGNQSREINQWLSPPQIAAPVF